MPNANTKQYLHLHFLVFIAGFTAILGQLISLNAIALVWYRMLIALVLIAIYALLTKTKLNISSKEIGKLTIAGSIIALHWITFFAAIKVSNISITLTMFSTGALFASVLEPIIYKRKIITYEMVFGALIIIGVYIITQSALTYVLGIVLGILSAFLSSLFAVLNGKFLRTHSATTISFYEFLSGVLFITIYLWSTQKFTTTFFQLSHTDWLYLFILGSVCTAYAFIASVYIMKYISPFTVVLTYNLEPLYGIVMALLLFPEQEKMNFSFYIGATLILLVVLFNAFLKQKAATKK